MQLTGRANYTRAGCELDLNLVDHPELAETASVAVDTACLYWSDHHLNKLADLDDIQAITRRVNGKRMLGLKARTAYLVKAKALLGPGSTLGDVVVPTRTAPDGSPIYTVQAGIPRQGTLFWPARSETRLHAPWRPPEPPARAQACDSEETVRPCRPSPSTGRPWIRSSRRCAVPASIRPRSRRGSSISGSATSTARTWPATPRR